MAGKWEDREDVKKIQNYLRRRGHIITVDWTWHEKEDVGYPSQYAVEDIVGASACDAYVGLFEKDVAYKGALVEMGAALSSGKKVYIIGHAIDSCLFVGHPFVQVFDTQMEFLSYMDMQRGER